MNDAANIPCRNPNVCKVQNHRPGTVAKCLGNSGGNSGPRASTSKLNIAPSLSGGNDSGDSVKLDRKGETLLKKLLSGKRVEIVTKDSVEGGTQQIIVLNGQSHTEFLLSDDAAASGHIVTASGVKVYSHEYSGLSDLRFKDGVEITNSIVPVADADDIIDGEITHDEFLALLNVNKTAYEVGHIDSISYGRDFSQDDLNREVVRRTLEIKQE